MTSRPIIGISLDWQEKGDFSERPHYALRQNYSDIVYEAGGLPIMIPYHEHIVEQYIGLCDGFLIPGGEFHFPKEWYQDTLESPFDVTPRCLNDVALIKEALEFDKPVLGICAGMQILACMHGAKLHPNIPTYTTTSINHADGANAEHATHEVIVEPKTLLERIVKIDQFGVNSSHIEAVISLPDSDTLVVNCKAPDGIIEGVELQQHRFAIGVQWHPEFFIKKSNPSFKLVKALVDAC